ARGGREPDQVGLALGVLAQDQDVGMRHACRGEIDAAVPFSDFDQAPLLAEELAFGGEIRDREAHILQIGYSGRHRSAPLSCATPMPRSETSADADSVSARLLRNGGDETGRVDAAAKLAPAVL